MEWMRFSPSTDEIDWEGPVTMRQVRVAELMVNPDSGDLPRQIYTGTVCVCPEGFEALMSVDELVRADGKSRLVHGVPVSLGIYTDQDAAEGAVHTYLEPVLAAWG
jgi:hypothetical protein